MLCRFHEQDCTFLEAALPRKRKADDSGRNDASPNKRLALSNEISLILADHCSPRPNQVASRSQPATETHQAVEQMPVIQPVSSNSVDDLSILDTTLSLQRYRHCRYIGRTSALDTSLLGLCDFDAMNEARLACGDIRQINPHGFFEMISDAAYPTHDDELQSLYEVEQIVAPHGQALIDIYFSNVHPSFPIIQKQVFLNRHRHGDRQFNSALLASMYLLALRWWSKDSILASQRMPSVEALEDVAYRALNVALQRPKLSALQAGLLLLQRSHHNAWGLTVQLVALGQELGLHLDCSTWSIPIWEGRLRKRLAWALYLQDKWAALVHGRPCHIQATDWAVPHLTSADYSDSTIVDDEEIDPLCELPTPPEHSIIFSEMIELTAIMGEVIDTFYTQRAIGEFDKAGKNVTGLILSKAKPVQIKLKNWFTKLPAEARMDGYETGKLSSNGYLHLAYFATEISIHRRIIQSLNHKTSDPYMMYICRSAAKTRLISAMDFVNRLKPEHLDAFWLGASPTNFALIATFGNLLRATAPGHEEASFYESRLHEYRWALCMSAKKAEWIEGAVDMLDMTNAILSNLAEKPRSATQSPKDRDSIIEE